MTNRTSHRPRILLGVLAVAACLPYLSLKIAWVAGSGIGIPEGSPLRAGGGALLAVNALTVVMDAFVVVLVLALIRPWGGRLPPWVLALPLWVATGLLGPIAVAFPVQILQKAVSGGNASATGSQGAGGRALLDDWVFSVVYSGFVCQALALGALIVLYGRDRWGRLLRGPVTPEGQRPSVGSSFAALAGSGALLTAGVHAVLAFRAGTGPGDSGGAHGPDTVVVEAAFTLFALLAAAGVLLAARRGGTKPLPAPFAAVWTGSGVLACWGAWWLLSALTVSDKGLGEAPTPLVLGTYAGQMLVGLGIAGFGARALVRRTALVRTVVPASRQTA